MEKRISLDINGTHYYTVDRAGVIDNATSAYYLVTCDNVSERTFTTYYYDQEWQALEMATHMLQQKLEHDLVDSSIFAVRLVLVIGEHRQPIIDTL